MEKENIYIFTECGPHIGLGHIVRCSALYDELASRGYPVSFIVYSESDNMVRTVLGKRKYCLSNWYADPCKGMHVDKNDYAIVDSYLAEAWTYEQIAKAVACKRKVAGAVYLDDTNRIDYPSGIIVNPSLFGEELPYSKKENQTYLLGPQYVILRKAFYELPADLREKRAKRKGHIKDILIIMGGTDMKNLTPKIMKALNESDAYRDCKQHVVTGNGFDNRDAIQAAAKTAKLYHNINAEEMRNLMLSCDAAISAAGQTVNEMIATQMPFVCVKAADNQEYNIRGLQKHGMISEYFDCEGKTDAQINKELQRLPEMLNDLKVSRGVENTVKIENGAENIVNRLVD